MADTREELQKVSCTVNFSNGVDAKGYMKTVGGGIGTLNADAWDADKAFNIAVLYSNCSGLTRYSVTSSKTSELKRD